MKTPLLISFFLITTGTLMGQKASLAKNLKLADSLFTVNPTEALEICEENISIALEYGDSTYSTFFLDVAGELNRRIGNYDRAINQLSQSLTLKSNWTNSQDLSLTHNDLGKSYINKGLYELAGYHLLEALKLMEESDNTMGQGFYLNNLGALFDLQHNYEKAIQYYQKSLDLTVAISDTTGIAASSLNLGISYYNLGDYPKAIEMHKKSVEIYRQYDLPVKLARALQNLSKSYYENQDFAQYSLTLMEAYQLLPKVNVASDQIAILNRMSQYYQYKELLDSSLYYNAQAIKLAEETRGYEKLKTVYSEKSKIQQLMNQPNEALNSLKISNQYNDSLVHKENIYALADMEGKYNYEKNRRVIKEQELQSVIQKEAFEADIQDRKLRFLYLGIVLIFIGAIAIVLYILYHNKNRKHNLLQGQNALIAKRNSELDHLNTIIKSEVSNLKLSLEDKEELLSNVFEKNKSKELPEELLSLSKREMEVLSHLALGYSDDQLAEKLFVSKSTIKTHLRRIYSKLLVRGRTEAVVIAHKYNLIGDDSL